MIPTAVFTLLGLQLLSCVVAVSIYPRQLQEPGDDIPVNTFARITSSDELRWQLCYQDKEAAESAVIECAKLNAPLDYTNPSDPRVAKLAIVRARRSKHEYREQEPCFLNPGGPGGDPIQLLLTFGDLPPFCGDSTDLYAVVPRAVGATWPPAPCFRDNQTRSAWVTTFTKEFAVATEDSLGAIDAAAAAAADDCFSVSGDVMPHMGTVSTARDIVHVADRLGFRKLNFYGTSYGTVLGTTLAVLFPDRIGRMVLDGVVDANAWWSVKTAAGSLEDADLVLEEIHQQCSDAGKERCPLWAPGGPTAIKERLLEANRRIKEAPLEVPGLGQLTYPLWARSMFLLSYAPSIFAKTMTALAAQVLSGVPGEEVRSVTTVSMWEPEPPLVDPNTGLVNGAEGLMMISCGDGNMRLPHVDDEILKGFLRESAPVALFGGPSWVITQITCARHKIAAKERITRKLENIQTSPILFICNTADPSTPCSGAEVMHAAFPGSGLLRLDVVGHTTQNSGTNMTCVTDWVRKYVGQGILPPDNTVCEGNQDLFAA